MLQMRVIIGAINGPVSLSSLALMLSISVVWDQVWPGNWLQMFLKWGECEKDFLEVLSFQ